MDKLKNYTTKNSGRFDDSEPNSGHADRFAARLRAANRRKKRPVRVLLSAVSGIAAAALVVLFLLPANQVEQGATCSLSPELAEVSSYYALQVESEIDRVQHLVAGADMETKKRVLGDIMDMRADSSEFLQQMCATNADESFTIPVIIQHYQCQLDALQTAAAALS